MPDNNRKCQHGRDSLFCCRCNYGQIRNEREWPRDMVDDIEMPIGYKLTAGFSLVERY